MDLNLSNAGVVVVGGANGIGRAIAEAFVAEGSIVALLDRSPITEAAASAVADLYSARVIGHTLDAVDYEMVRASAEMVATQIGRIDHVIYAAGMGSGKFGFPFWNLDPSDWQGVLNVNLMGAVNVAHAFSPYLIESGTGSLQFIASIAGQIGSQTDPPYSAAKAALINFAMCAAKDLAVHNIRVNSICPGMIKTDLNRSVWQAWNEKQADKDRLDYDAWGAAKVKQIAPMGRWQEPSEIGALCVYLASPNGVNITGQTLNVDGGQVMHW